MSDNHEKMPIAESGQCITLFSWNGESAVIPREINGTPVIELRRINLPEAKVIEIPDSINSMSCNINLHYQVKQTVVHEKLQERIWNAESRSTSRSIRTQYDEEGNELRFIEEYSDQEKVSEAIEKIWYKRELHSVLNCCPKLREIIVDPRNSEYSSREGALYSKSGSTLISVPQDWPGETFILGESVRSVESNAFGGCRNIRRIVLPDVPLHVNDGRDFANCAALEEIVVSDAHPTLEWRDGMLFERETKRLLFAANRRGTVHVPEGTTEIGDYAFMNCYRMTRVIIPGSVRRIGEYAFDNCYGLKGEAVEFTDGVEYIGDGAFGSVTCQLCSDFYDVGLCRIQLPASVTYIGENAFNNPYGEVDLLAPPGSYAEQWWKENGEAFYE